MMRLRTEPYAPSRLRAALAGVTRAALAEVVRNGFPPDGPEVLRFTSGVGWRLHRTLAPVRATRVREVLAERFGARGSALDALCREAHDLALQARLETLLIPRMTDAQLGALVRCRGMVRPPCVVVHPHVGPLVLLVRALASVVGRERLVVYRPAPPAPPASCGAADAWRERRREEDDARLGIAVESEPTALAGRLARGHVVVAAFDEAYAEGGAVLPFLGVPTRFDPAPWDAARATGASIVPATLVRERDKTYVLTFRPPRAPDLPAYLTDEAEPFLRAHPGHYAPWLATGPS
jgi:lauroyl/myristoyl acyltransferase